MPKETIRERLVRIESKLDNLCKSVDTFNAKIRNVDGRVWGLGLLILGASITVIAILAQ